MASTHAPALPRPRIAPGVVDAAVALVALAVVAWMTLMTPAFTDYEVEIEPALQALMRGDLATVGRIIPIYGGSLALQAPFSGLGFLIGGDVGMYRATVIPGALVMVVLALLAARWLRQTGRSRLEQLGVVGLVAASPTLAQAWSIGHAEEVLVAGAAIGGILLIDAAGVDRRRLLFLGAFCLGLACGGKLWPAALLPVALAATRTRPDALRVLLTTGFTAAAMVVPNALAHLSFFKSNVASVGGGGVFTPGNAWWFFGSRNPDWADPTFTGERAFHVGGNSFRNPPELVTAIDHPLVMLLACGLAAGWWWRMRRSADSLTAAQRTASLLMLVAAVIWWRAVLDGWFQAYYLTGAVAALALADARRGRTPLLAAFVFGALWLLAGQSELVVGGWSPDLYSAVMIAWLVPVGVWSSVRALRSAG